MALTLKQVLSSDSIPSLPAVALRVIQLARAPEPNIKQLVSVIKSDPALAARVLRTANSSLFGVRERVTAIEQAVPLLGTVTVRAVVLTFSLAETSTRPGVVAEHYQSVWRSSLTQALAADSLAKHDRRGNPADYFVAGLLQDLGVLALLRTAPEQYVPALLAQDQEPQKTLVQIERERFGFSHVDVSVELCRRWGMPETTLEAIATHHQGLDEFEHPGRPGPSALALALNMSAAVAEYFCRSSKQWARAVVEELAKRYYKFDLNTLHQLLDCISTRLRETADLFAFDIGACPPYAEILSQANAELANLAIRAQMANMEAGAMIEAAQRELRELEDQKEHLRSRAYRDSLTGTYNRLFFDEVLEREHSRCVRYGGSIGLIFLDLDHFKDLNDSFGHLFGDEVLREVAAAIQSAVRQSDMVARFGGEEFVVLVLYVNQEDLLRTAERIREAIQSLVIDCRGQEVRVTASVGATLFEGHQSAPPAHSRMVEKADLAMYAAKRDGRNRVQFVACGAC